MYIFHDRKLEWKCNINLQEGEHESYNVFQYKAKQVTKQKNHAGLKDKRNKAFTTR